MRLLVCDDEVVISKLVARVFQTIAEVAVTCSADEASQVLVQGAPIDLVLCDLHMPGLGGLDLHAKVAALDPDLAGRFVFLTGGVSDGDLQRGVEATGLPVFEKPFTAAQLREFVQLRVAALGLRSS